MVASERQGFITNREDRGMPIRTLAFVLKRGVVGFVAGWIVACFVLTLLGAALMVPASELSILGIENRNRALWIATVVALVLSLIVMVLGRTGVSRFWFWFAVAYGITCVVPTSRHEGGHLLPFVTPYLNFGIRAVDVWLVVAQFVISAGIAALLHNGCLRMRLYSEESLPGNAEAGPVEPGSTG
jgi:hypothetical protein